MSSVLSFRSVVFSVFLSTALASPVAAQQYYRWQFAPAFTCTTVGPSVHVLFASQPVEWNLPAGAQFSIIYSENGVETPTGPFPAPFPPGSFTFGALSDTGFSGYPATFAVRLESFVSAILTYRSTLTGTCAAEGPGSSSVLNEDVSAVPTLTPVTLAALVGMLLLLGVATLRRRTAG